MNVINNKYELLSEIYHETLNSDKKLNIHYNSCLLCICKSITRKHSEFSYSFSSCSPKQWFGPYNTSRIPSSMRYFLKIHVNRFAITTLC